MIIGYLAGYHLADKNRFISGCVGVLLAGAAWVVLCWVFAFIMRIHLLRRGYDLSPRTKHGDSKAQSKPPEHFWRLVAVFAAALLAISIAVVLLL